MKTPNFKTLLILLFSLQLSLFAIPEDQDSIFYKLKHSKFNYFENKLMFDQITNDTLLLKIAVNLDNNHFFDKLNNNFFKYRALLRIKNKELIWNKLDSIRLDYELMNRLLSDAHEPAIKIFLLSKGVKYGEELGNIFIKNKLLPKITDPFFFLDTEPLRHFDFSMDIILYLKNLKFTKQNIQKILNEKQIKGYFTYILAAYTLNNFDTFAAMNFSETNSGIRSKFTGLFKPLNLVEIDSITKNAANMRNIIFDRKADLRKRTLALLKININEIDLEMYKMLPYTLKIPAILRTQDPNKLFSFLVSTSLYEEQVYILLKISDQNILRKIIKAAEKNEILLHQQACPFLFAKINDDNLVYDFYMNKTDSLKRRSIFSKNIIFKSDEIKYKLLKFYTKSYKEKNYDPYRQLLFGLKNENIIREILFGDFTKKIKDDVLQLVTNEKLLFEVILSDLDISYKQNCIYHPFMSNDSLLFEIARDKKTDFRLAEQIAKKLNVNTLDNYLANSYSNPKVRKKIIKRTSDNDSLMSFVLKDPDKDLRLDALNKIDDNEILKKIHNIFKNIVDKSNRERIPGYQDILEHSASKINDQNMLYQMAMESSYDYYIVRNRHLKDNELIYKILTENLKNIETAPPGEWAFTFTHSMKILISKLFNDSLLEEVSRQEGNQKIVSKVAKYANSKHSKKYLIFSYKHATDLSNKEAIIKKLFTEREFVSELFEIEKNDSIRNSIKARISENESKIEEAKKILHSGGDYELYLKYFRNDQMALKWLYENAKKTKNQSEQFYKDYVIDIIEDMEYLGKKINDYDTNSEKWKKIFPRINVETLLNIFNSPDIDQSKKEYFISQISNYNLLSTISIGNVDNNIKNAALNSINDEVFLYDFYLKYMADSKSNFNDFYYSVLRKLSDKYILKILETRTDPQERSSLRQLVSDQKLILEFIHTYKEPALLGNLEDYNTRKNLFWEIKDDKFRRAAIGYCSSEDKAEDEVFYKKVLKEISDEKVRSSVIRHFDHPSDFSFLIEYFEKDSAKVVRENILSNLYYKYLGYGKFENDPLNVKTEEFLKKVSTDEAVSNQVRSKAYEYIVDKRKNDISKIDNENELLPLFKTETEPVIINHLFYKYSYLLNEKFHEEPQETKNENYDKALNSFIEDYLKDRKSVDEKIISCLISYASNPTALQLLYGFTHDITSRNLIIIKIDDDRFIEKIIKTENQNALCLFNALTKVKDQKLVSELIDKYKENDKYTELLIWRCSTQDILENILSSTKNDTLALIAKMKIELINSPDDISLDKFFDDWRKAILPLYEAELHNLSGINKDAYELYNLQLSRIYKDGYKNKYIVLPANINCKIGIIEDNAAENYKELPSDNIVINNFRPTTAELEGKILYLDELYRKVIDSYIKYCLIDFGKHKSESEESLIGMSYFRHNIQMKEEYLRNLLLNKYIPSYQYSWGSNYILTTYPDISQINFYQGSNKVYFRYHSGNNIITDFYVKENGKWKYTHTSEDHWDSL